MAKYERKLEGDFDNVLGKIEDGMLSGSFTASLEESSDFISGEARCSVRVFERYSFLGANRVSLSVTLFQNNNEIFLSAISSGGSQAMFFKLNTMGEEAFLQKLINIIE